MPHEKIRKSFDAAARDYDQHRRAVIPHLDELYEVTADLAHSSNEKPRVLDLGAGTGLLTEYLFKRYPEAEFTLMDLSGEMLAVARERFEGHSNFRYIQEDYVEEDFEGTYDIVISSLSIHHLSHENKEFLYKKVYDNLNMGGIFINADEVRGSTGRAEREYQRKHDENLESQPLTEEQKATIYKRRQLDNPATLATTLKWFDEIGFGDVDVFYKYYEYCVIAGRKVHI
ncbi:class I SAM-dependent methyltransferase [Methanobacterium aggregans]|uniref:class I SAM-dependent methyltransferase n=1 Tax=Methanobacterium aggregans TaxID=1615586 RepID=UPI001AE552A5|nr:class I SAM-dependent methyltransferase [Methanobacterium aggregans]MBP2045816.1 tRNA (cmo5U34)-methyltransferase [Methanobacterium aggregans]